MISQPKNRPLLLVLLLIAGMLMPAVTAFAQQALTYSEVQLEAGPSSQLNELNALGMSVDAFRGNFDEGIILVLNQHELEDLRLAGFQFKVLIADVYKDYLQRANASRESSANNHLQLAADGIEGYSPGSMGGFHTYQEVNQLLDSLRQIHSNIISARTHIGFTHEGRSIWAVKISDNPDVDESASESGAYFDGLHHAREPIGLEVQLYFIYWLMDNYGVDPEATYLVDNRELFFVPIVNPDGYVYNQNTAPDGGGLWRKNRRNHGNCFGVDLNRNYEVGFDSNAPSSDPCSEVYRGSEAFSEPEAAAIRDYILRIDPEIAFTLHAVRGAYLNPYAFMEMSPSFDIYSEFASDFAASNQYLYGRTSEILDYNASGTSRDYFHSQGIITWEVEVGGSGFWPTPAEIIPLASENLAGMKYLAWVAGGYADLQYFQVADNQDILNGDTLKLVATIKNRGLGDLASNVEFRIEAASSALQPVQNRINFGSIEARHTASNREQPLRFVLPSTYRSVEEELTLYLTLLQESVVTSRDTIKLRVGATEVLFEDYADNGTAAWIADGPGQAWDTTFVDAWSGRYAFADSRYGSSRSNTANSFTLAKSIDLTEANSPFVTFYAKWAIESGFDYAQLQISTDDGANWSPVGGKYTATFREEPAYFGVQYWVAEEIDLTPWIGKIIRLRFAMNTDSGINGDGFYFDDFKVVDFNLPSIVSIDEDSPLAPAELELYQNYPNPFNPETQIAYLVPASLSGKQLTVDVFDALGRHVTNLVNGPQPAGHHRVTWNGHNDLGQPVSSGVYVYRILVDGQVKLRKLLLVR